MNTENENLKELLAKFMDEGLARQTAEDIEKGEEALRQFAAPELEGKVLTQIKERIALKLKRRQTIYVIKQRLWIAAGVAAMLAIGVFLSLKFEQDGTTRPAQVQIASAVWDGSDDADVSVLKAEVETVQNILAGVEVNDNTAAGNNLAENDLEMELIEISSNFWKG